MSISCEYWVSCTAAFKVCSLSISAFSSDVISFSLSTFCNPTIKVSISFSSMLISSHFFGSAIILFSTPSDWDDPCFLTSISLSTALDIFSLSSKLKVLHELSSVGSMFTTAFSMIGSLPSDSSASLTSFICFSSCDIR